MPGIYLQANAKEKNKKNSQAEIKRKKNTPK